MKSIVVFSAILTALFSAALPVESLAQLEGPVLRVTVNDLPPFVFPPGPSPVMLTINALQPIHISWEASPGASGEPFDATRHGWNIRNPANDEEWDQSWCTACSSVTRAFSVGIHRFFLEGRDAAGSITHVEIEIVIQQLAIETKPWAGVKRLYDLN